MMTVKGRWHEATKLVSYLKKSSWESLTFRHCSLVTYIPKDLEKPH